MNEIRQIWCNINQVTHYAKLYSFWYEKVTIDNGTQNVIFNQDSNYCNKSKERERKKRRSNHAVCITVSVTPFSKSLN